MVTRALSMLISIAKKAIWCVRSFRLVESSYKILSLAWVRQWLAYRDKSFQAYPLLFVLQATKAGDGGLGMRPGNEAWGRGLGTRPGDEAKVVQSKLIVESWMLKPLDKPLNQLATAGD